MVRVTGVRTRAVRFPLGAGDGSDSVHQSGYYGYAVAILETDGSLEGHGLAFTLGGGTGSITSLVGALVERGGLCGREIEAVMSEFGAVYDKMANHGQLRWLGPEKGSVQSALCAVVNACWDLWAKSREQPLFSLLLSLTPAELVRTLPLRGIETELSAAEAREYLRECEPSRAEREGVLVAGYPGYDTSFGWLLLDDATIRQRAEIALEKGFRAVKLKIGSPDPERDLRRAKLVRDIVGPDVTVMLDVNQQWSLPTAKSLAAPLAEIKPFWIEEPLHPDDVEGHRELAEAWGREGMHVAVGEAIPNRVVFKTFLERGACGVVQLDPCRQGGVSECIVIALMAARRGLEVSPHAGDMGQISQHLVLFFHIALSTNLLFLEHIPHLQQHFKHPATCARGHWKVPTAPGASTELKPHAGEEEGEGGGGEGGGEGGERKVEGVRKGGGEEKESNSAAEGGPAHETPSHAASGGGARDG